MNFKPVVRSLGGIGGALCGLLLALVDPFAEIPEHLVQVVQPAVLVTGGYGRDDSVHRRFADAVGVSSRTPPESADILIPIEHVTRVNPYPQPLDVVYGRDVNYVSYGYVGADERYHHRSSMSIESTGARIRAAVITDLRSSGSR
jgi:hypothetical protein